MDVCVENVFPAVAVPFNPFHDDAREGKQQEADASRIRAIPNIVYVAVDAFFASVEQVLNPQLRGKPVLVGCEAVASASSEAKLCGVKPGMMIREAMKMSPNAIAVPGHYEIYADFAERVRRILETYSPAVEAGSLDDFYLDFTGTKQTYSAYEAMLRRVQTEVLEETGLTVSIGAARTRVVASTAARVERPRGLRMIVPGTEDDFLSPLPVETLGGVGAPQARMLGERGIAMVGELRRVPRVALESAFGEMSGRRIWEQARGIDGHDLRTLSAPKRALVSRGIARHETVRRETVSREMTVEVGMIEPEFLAGILRYLCERIGSSLRESGRQARTIGLRICYVDAFEAQQTARLMRPSNDERHLLAEAKELFAELFTRRVALRTVAVAATNLERDSREEELEDRAFVQTVAQHAAPLQMPIAASR